jgi:hypothetical protein
MRAAQFLAIIGRGSKGSNALENTEDRAGATSEQQDNVINTVNSLDPYGPSWQLVPGNVAAGTVYAQVPTSGTGDLAFTRGSTKTRTNAAGTVVNVASGVAAIDYRNADGSLSSTGRLLLEAQRTNVALQSETITAGTGTTVTLDTTSAPTGLNTADKLVEDTSTGLHFTSFGGLLGGTVDSSVYCVGIFAKAAGRTRFTMFDNGQVTAGSSTFDLSNGTVVSGTGRIENYGSGWYRCTIFPAKSTSTTANVQIRIVDTGTNTSYTGNGTSGLFLWGKQIEANATYPSSYIPTTTAAVTRLAEIPQKTGVASLIGQSAGAFFADINISAFNTITTIFTVSDGTGNNRIRLRRTGAQVFNLARDLTGQTAAAVILTTAPVSGRMKIAGAWSSATNGFVLCINGVLQANAGAVPMFTNELSVINLGTFPGTGAELMPGIEDAASFTYRPTNAKLIEMTTL